jgi:subtilisin family serine protease
VSGIITSNGIIAPPGVAPEADIFAYKVLPDTGFGNMAFVLLALEDVALANADPGREDMEFINISISDGGAHSDVGECEALIPALRDFVAWLRAVQGTLTIVASANSTSRSGVGYPACLPSVVSVGAVYDANVGPQHYQICDPDDLSTAADQVACFSQSSDDLDLLAPGAVIESTFPDHFTHNTTCTSPPEPLATQGRGPCRGTSMASPLATGVAALLKQAQPALTTDQMEDRLKATGRLVTDVWDPANIRSFPRTDARVALLTNDAADTDQDGCTNGREFQTAAGSQAIGGVRNPLDFRDFMDQYTGLPLARDRAVAGADVAAVVARFGATGNPNGDPLTPPAGQSGYHVIADRNGNYPGANPWDLKPPNGSITGADIGAAVAQFGHSCA